MYQWSTEENYKVFEPSIFGKIKLHERDRFFLARDITWITQFLPRFVDLLLTKWQIERFPSWIFDAMPFLKPQRATWCERRAEACKRNGWRHAIYSPETKRIAKAHYKGQWRNDKREGKGIGVNRCYKIFPDPSSNAHSTWDSISPYPMFLQQNMCKKLFWL